MKLSTLVPTFKSKLHSKQGFPSVLELAWSPTASWAPLSSTVALLKARVPPSLALDQG